MSEQAQTLSDDREALLARLREIRAVLGPPEGPERERLYDERIDLYERLAAMGETHATIGAAFGVSAGAVGDALRKARKGVKSNRYNRA